ncbi:hypothetical protein K2173_009101 [Erythroxylum novogranatense]|uniref:RNA helicase n=1 Tax=Erythroxylum novogranatense TaxID=1862640 RepID=A0AAV8TE72_9ROSI|nr:hypothetical protein K2173_009101 [Erythroxylum novogranatense]
MVHPHHRHRRHPQFSGHDLPPQQRWRACPQFLVKLLCDSCNFHRQRTGRTVPIETVLSQCNPRPYRSDTKGSGPIAACLYFRDRADALNAVVHLWGQRLADEHVFIPEVDFGVSEDVNDKIKTLFLLHVEKVLEGDCVKKLKKRAADLCGEIRKCEVLPRRSKGLQAIAEIKDKENGLKLERDGIARRIEEFRSGMKCLTECIEGKQSKEFGVLRFGTEDGLNWFRIHAMLSRECRRLEDGLPIYGFRREILSRINSQQVMILVGETGSGKSTQLVQFLADSGVPTSGSVLCTQPRKVAAISLAKRVGEESIRCYEENAIACYPSYSSAQMFDSRVVYMTDYCLLRHLMKDEALSEVSSTALSKVSCIIVDEAHERSLNTDLLLAMIQKLLMIRPDLRLVVMSATVDSRKLSEYFYGCGTFYVLGRNFPVDIKYVPDAPRASSTLFNNSNVALYVSDVVNMAMQIHESEGEGAILAFLTSQLEVEWACEKFQSPSAIALPLHGKLSHEEQFRVFQNYPGKRNVIFSTNLAETSLTIPGVKYVVDCGMVKESRFEPTSGMNILRVSRISKSSANQRAGRAGRIGPGKCYRLYSTDDYQSMACHQEPEICKVHLGIAVLRILALGSMDVLAFDFIDAPSVEAVDMAIKNLVHLGAISCKNDLLELTFDGHDLVKLGIEPRLGKIILESVRYNLIKEGVVLAAVMANANSIFCRVGDVDDKLKSDRLKVRFCHQDGDLFTLLSVYMEWERVHPDYRNKWCWDNSINAKTMRRCRETVVELENCLKNELSIIVPTYWNWSPHIVSEYDKQMKKIILSSLAENVAMYSGYDRLGYEVVSSGESFQLHPSCSLQMYSQKPNWVVFCELLSISSQYLVCVSAIDFDTLSDSSPLFDVSKVESRKLMLRLIKGFGSTVLKRFCGKSNNSLLLLLQRVQSTFQDKRIGIEVNVDNNEIQLFAPKQVMENVHNLVHEALTYEKKWLINECLERCLFRGVRAGASPPIALLGAGAEIRHLELDNRYLSVDVSFPSKNALDDKEILTFFEKSVSGVCSFHKFTAIGQDGDDTTKWGRVTFLSPAAARKALDYNEIELSGSLVQLAPAWSFTGGNKKLSFPAVRAKVIWPRRYSKGYAIVRCERNDAEFVVRDCFNLLIGGRFIHCEVSTKDVNSIIIRGLDREISEVELLEFLQMATNRRILDVFLIRGDAVIGPSLTACEEAILKEIAPFMPDQAPLSDYCHVKVFPSEPKDNFMKALITFDGRLHLEAAKALQHIQGKVLSGCFSWQKMQCHQVFHSSVSCPAPVYVFIERQLNSLVRSFNHRPGVICKSERNENGSYRVKICANATKTVAELRRPLEKLMNGKTVTCDTLTPAVLQLLISKDGFYLMKTLQCELGIYILFERQNRSVRIFGPENKVAIAEQKLIKSLLTLYDNQRTYICLRGAPSPPDLMKKLVEKYGPDLRGLNEIFPEAELMLNTRRHAISFKGKRELRLRVEEIIYDFKQSLSLGGCTKLSEDVSSCPICLCEVEDSYQLEGCAHKFCRSCLVDQLESAIRSQDGFPIRCACEGCGMHVWLTDIKSLLSCERLEDLFRASLAAFVASSGGTYRFCPSPDCPSVYRVAETGMTGNPFVCGACFAETCTKCHLEYHPYVSCERYKEFKDDPDMSLKKWCKGKEHVRSCPCCGYMIEKVEGCNHVECRCGKHICWVCTECFSCSDDCYGHLRSVHLAIV